MKRREIKEMGCAGHKGSLQWRGRIPLEFAKAGLVRLAKSTINYAKLNSNVGSKTKGRGREGVGTTNF